MLKGFRDFILRGNVIDLAVAVIVGAAFTAIVNSLVTNVINPLIAATVRKPDFSAFVIELHGGKIKIGDFMNAAISFLIIAAVVYFGIVMPVNFFLERIKNHGPIPPPPPAMKICSECLSDIPAAAKRCAHCGQPQLVTAAEAVAGS